MNRHLLTRHVFAKIKKILARSGKERKTVQEGETETKSLIINKFFAALAAGESDVENLFRKVGGEPYEICTTVLSSSFCNAPIRGALYEHFLRLGDLPFARKILRLSSSTRDASLALWLMADAAESQGLRDEAAETYREVTSLKLQTEVDYLHVGLAFYRLRHDRRAIEVLQEGRITFPNSPQLLESFEYVCTASGNVSLIAASLDSRESSLAYLIEHVGHYAKKGVPEYFVIHHKGYVLHLGEQDFELLADAFIAVLQDNLPDQKRRELLLFFARMLDGDAAFCQSLYDVLKNGNVKDDFKLDILYHLTCMYIPARKVSADEVHNEFQRSCTVLSEQKMLLDDPIRDLTESFSPWHALFSLCSPTQYAAAMESFQTFSLKVWPQLNYTAPHIGARRRVSASKIKIGFMAHPAMPMMSGLMSGLDRTKFEPIYLGPGKADNSYTAKTWQERGNEAIFYNDADMRLAIETISAQKLDIVLSAPSQPSVLYPVMAKLAPLNIVVLEPNWTDGFTSSDYYMSWLPAEPPIPERFYRSKVAYLDHPPYWIDDRFDHSVKLTELERQKILARLTGKKEGERVYLCPSTPPKLHSLMDEIILRIMERDPNAVFACLRSDFPAARNLQIRWREKLGRNFERIRFLPTLERSDAHLLLHAVDCTIDSYPIGGMSSSFDSAILGIPTVTWPAEIPFGRWLTAIYEYIGVTGLTADSMTGYVDLAVRMANDPRWRREKSMEIRLKSHVLVENKASLEGAQTFLLAAWDRYEAGLPNANWISNRWV